jgi:hypothetical protein
MTTVARLYLRVYWFACLSLIASFLPATINAEGTSVGKLPTTDVSLHTGAATLSIPIEVPPGRNGMQPKLALIYNSYQRNGWIGTGWDLDMGAIQRSTKSVVDYSTDKYVAVVNGAANELVPRSEWGAQHYGKKIEDEFSKYYFNSVTGGWEATAKDGTKYFYGSSSNSQQKSTHGVFKWCLDKVVDTNGNYMEISYSKDSGQIYLDRIAYAGNGPEGLSPSNYIQFHLENRSDIFTSYRTRKKVQTAKLLSAIEIQSHDGLVRSVRLKY